MRPISHRSSKSNADTTASKTHAAHHHRSSKGSTSSSSSSSPTDILSTMAVPTMTPLAVLPEDNEDYGSAALQPTIAVSSSPNTPPKKVWERSYRNFLKLRSKQHPVSIPPPPALPHGAQSASAAPTSSSSPPDSKTNKEESSVRGGKLFAHMFAASSPSVKGGRKVKSMSCDELDGTLRRGAEKAYSPGNTRYLVSTSSSTPPSSTSLPMFGEDAPAVVLRPRSEVFRQVSDSGLLKHRLVIAQEQQQQQQKQLDMSSSSSSAMKKAFTEFHNSSVTGRDAVSAYLGDDPSHCSRATVGHSLAWTHQQLQHQNHHEEVDAIQKLTYEKYSYSLCEFPTITATTSQPASPTTTTALHHHHAAQSPHLPTTTTSKHSPTSSAVNPTSSSFTGLEKTEIAAGARETVTAMPFPASALEPVHETTIVIRSNVRTLKPIQSVDVWQPGRRYLIAPAALAACPLPVLSTLAPGPCKTAVQVFLQQQQQQHENHPSSAFGTILLGKCLIASTSGSPGTASAAYTPLYQWSESILVLKQNYLLEYPPTADCYNPRGLPRGYAHLPYAICKDDPELLCLLRLEFYGSPCAKSDPRVLQIQLEKSNSKEERDAWKWCLNHAAQLTMEDLYEYDIGQVLGKGSYATVYEGRRLRCCSSPPGTVGDDTNDNDNNETQQHPCALKIFDKNQYWRMVVKGRERADTLVRETSVQATLTAKCGKIPSFVRIRGFFETADHVVLELELLEGGTDLFKYVSARGFLKEAKAAQILYDILLALEAMNRIGLAHRDVKPANVLMMSSCSSSAAAATPTSCKLADFGMATFVGVDGQLRGRCGTPGYVAPEIFTAAVHGGYGNKVDVFSAGVTLYVMLCGYEPFYGETDAELAAANKAAKIDFPEEDWKGVSIQARDLVQKMMHPDPRQRPSPSEALKHAWLDKAHDVKGDLLDRSTTLPAAEAPLEDACVIS